MNQFSDSESIHHLIFTYIHHIPKIWVPLKDRFVHTLHTKQLVHEAALRTNPSSPAACESNGLRCPTCRSYPSLENLDGTSVSMLFLNVFNGQINSVTSEQNQISSDSMIKFSGLSDLWRVVGGWHVAMGSVDDLGLPSPDGSARRT